MTDKPSKAQADKRAFSKKFQNYQIFDAPPIREIVAEPDPHLLKRPALEAVMLELLETEDAAYRILLKLDLNAGGEEPCVAVGIQPKDFEEEPTRPGDIIMPLGDWMDAFEGVYGFDDIDDGLWTRVHIARDIIHYKSLIPPSGNALRGFMLEYPGALNYLARLVYESYASSTMMTGTGFLVEIPGALNNASLLLGVSRPDDEDQKLSTDDFDN